MRLSLKIPRADERPFDVAGFGLNSVDLLAVVAEHPAVNSKQRLQRVTRLPGGQIATAMATCAKLGWRASYIGSFGGDDMGTLSRAEPGRRWRRRVRQPHGRGRHESVRHHPRRRPHGRANGAVGPASRSRLGSRRHSAQAAVTAGRMLIVDCHETAAATQAARYAREAGVPTIVDVEKVRPGIADLLHQIDIIITAQDFPCALTGYEDLGRALAAMADEFRAPIVCATLGEHGSLARCGGREIRTPAFQVDCVDTTGAGDVFRGAFAAGLPEVAGCATSRTSSSMPTPSPP